MFDPIEFRIRNLAVDSDTVLTERVDVITADGITAPGPVMGRFEIRDGRIVAWHDYFYFDIGLTGKLMAGEPSRLTTPPTDPSTDPVVPLSDDPPASRFVRQVTCPVDTVRIAGQRHR